MKILAAIVLGAAVAASSLPATADVRHAKQAISIQTDKAIPLDSSTTKAVFCKMRKDGANRTTLMFPLEQDNVHSTTVYARPNKGYGAYTPSDAELAGAIKNAKDCGLKVDVKPGVELSNNEWRSHITFSDAQDDLSKAWFKSYQSWLVHYALVGKANHADGLVLGTEMVGMTLNKCSTDPDIPQGIWSCNKHNGARWAAMADAVKKTGFKGDVTYAPYRGSWNRPKESIMLPTEFTKKLTYVGLTYYPQTDGQDTTAAHMRGVVRGDVKNYFSKMHKRYGKNIVIEETGLRTKNEALQARWYSGVFAELDKVSYIKGVSVFRAYNQLGATQPDDDTFNYEGRDSEDQIIKWFGGHK